MLVATIVRNSKRRFTLKELQRQKVGIRESFSFGFLMPIKMQPMILGFPQNGSPFVELIVLIDFQNTSPNDEQYRHLVIVAHSYMIFEKHRRKVRNWRRGGSMWMKVRAYTTKNLQVAAASWTLRTMQLLLNRTQ